MIERYRIDDQQPLSKMGLPPFILPRDFDARSDLPTYNFNKEEGFREAILERLDRTVSDRKMNFFNALYHAITVLTMVCHVALFWALWSGALAPWMVVILMIGTRTAISGAGHYYVHAKKPNISEGLIDINYVASCILAHDVHVLLHHPHLGTKADCKTNFFASIWKVKVSWRPLAYTLEKLGATLFGIPALAYRITCVPGFFNFEKNKEKRLGFWLMRAWIWLEFLFCVLTGHGLFWLIQFFGTLWFNSYLILET